MNERRVNAFVALMCATAVLCLALADWQSLASLTVESWFGLVALIGIALLSEGLAIGLNMGGGGTSSITFLPLLAAVQLFGPEAGIILMLVTMAFTDAVVRRKDLRKALFNSAQVTVSTTVAGAAFAVLGGVAIHGIEDPDITSHLTPFITFGLIFLVVNHAAVSMVLTLSKDLPFRRVWHQLLSNSGGQLNDLLVAPLALAVAYLYLQFGIAGVLVILLPMLFVRYSYLTTAQLRAANEDLLTALVKAIETRDPYTSGHSQRVSLLAGQIAERVGLSRLSVERVKMAALLHDIGKIEAVYTDILRKPDSLTAEERSMIESHVTRGERLLRDLSSVPDEVVRAVRHHHEREDGRGYPDGLVGSEIPLGAKIIVMCDAVDAMLSDRPYRRALALPVVVEQLIVHAGTQFDEKLVSTLVDSDILVSYAQMMQLTRQAHGSDLSGDAPGVMPLPVPSLMTPPQPRARRYN